MSAQPSNPVSAPDHVNIEIDGRALQVPKGSMIIQAADRIGVAIPRFCYHRKLPIAANCRQCLVEVEMGGKPIPKPQPACATPVAEGMKIAKTTPIRIHFASFAFLADCSNRKPGSAKGAKIAKPGRIRIHFASFAPFADSSGNERAHAATPMSLSTSERPCST